MKLKSATGPKKNLLLFKKECKVVIFSLATPFVHTKMITGPEKMYLLKGYLGRALFSFVISIILG